MGLVLVLVVLVVLVVARKQSQLLVFQLKSAGSEASPQSGLEFDNIQRDSVFHGSRSEERSDQVAKAWGGW